jgi:hypothetical protein
MKRLSIVFLHAVISYGILACARQPVIVTPPPIQAKPTGSGPVVTISPAPGTQPLENSKGPWKFTYTPGSYRYTIVTAAKIALQSDTNAKRELPTVSERTSIVVTKNGDVQVTDPPRSTSVACDTMAALVTRAQELLPKIPEHLVADSTWNDSSVTTGCRGSISTTVKATYTYTVLQDTLYDGTQALHVKRVDILTAQGAGNEGQHQISLMASGTGTIHFYFDATSGLLLGSLNDQVTKLDITTSGQIEHFLQYVTEHVALVKTP